MQILNVPKILPQVSMPREDTFLLAYVVAESIRALLTISVIQSHLPISSVLITLLGELTKFVVALIYLANGAGFKMSSIKAKLLFSSDWREYMAISIPAIMYFISTLSYMMAIQFTMPSTLRVSMIAKLPCTAILHHLFITPQRSFCAWISLVFLTFGIVLVNVPSYLITIITGAPRSAYQEENQFSLLEPLIGLLIAVTSAFASIYTETILKTNVPFWVTQTWMYAFGSLAGAVTLGVCDGQLASTAKELPVASSLHSTTLQILVVAAVAGRGLVVANILRRKDNLVKIVGSSASLVVIIIAQRLLFPHLFSNTVTMRTTTGLGITWISTWTYNSYKRKGKRGERIQETQNKMIRTRQLLFWACVVMAQLTLFTLQIFSLQPSQLTSLNKPFRWFNNGFRWQTPMNDIERFFLPYNVTPAEWAIDANPSPRCAWDYILQHDINARSSEIINWAEAYLDTNCPVYPVPETGMIFHFYWRGRWRSFNDLSIEAFLATQRLEDGHRLIYWYEDGGPPASTLEMFQPYSEYVEFREVDMLAESKGYCLEHMREWNDRTYRETLGMSIMTLSDMFRILLLTKYGGLWVDADAILLRDLTPLIRMGPWCVGTMLNPNAGFGTWNNALLNYGPVGLGLGEKVLDLVCRMPFDPKKFREVWPGFEPPEWWVLYNWSLMKILEEKEGCRIGAIPQTWVDVYVEAPCAVVEDGTLPGKFRGLFVWHSKLDDELDSCLADGSPTTAAKMRRSIWRMLDEGLDLSGRDVIPQSLCRGLMESW